MAEFSNDWYVNNQSRASAVYFQGLYCLPYRDQRARVKMDGRKSFNSNWTSLLNPCNFAQLLHRVDGAKRTVPIVPGVN